MLRTPHPRTLRLPSLLIVAALLPALLAIGCGDAEPKKPGKKSTKTAEPAATAPAPAADDPAANEVWKPTGELPKLDDDPLPAFDEGRIEVRLLDGWHRQPRSNQYLAAQLEASNSKYPQLFVVVEESPTVNDFTKDNIQSQREKSQADPKIAKALQGSVRMCGVGGRPGLYRRSRAEAGAGIELDVLTFLTVVDGRRYEVQLRATRGEGKKYENHAAAVAAGLAFPKAAD